MKGLPQRVATSLAQLKAIDQTDFSGQVARACAPRDRSVSAVYEALLRDGVECALALPDSVSSGDGHVHEVVPCPGNGGGICEPDETLEWLERDLNSRQGNFQKLAESGARQCHLFVWLDDETPYSVARAVLRASPDGPLESLPARPPRLAQVVTHLWVVHEESEAGWLWERRSGVGSRRRRVAPLSGHRVGAWVVGRILGSRGHRFAALVAFLNGS